MQVNAPTHDPESPSHRLTPSPSLPPLPEAAVPLLNAFLEHRGQLVPIAAATGLPFHEVLQQLSAAPLCDYLARLAALRTEADRAFAIGALRETITATDSPIEKRRAASAILRATNPRPVYVLRSAAGASPSSPFGGGGSDRRSRSLTEGALSPTATSDPHRASDPDPTNPTLSPAHPPDPHTTPSDPCPSAESAACSPLSLSPSDPRPSAESAARPVPSILDRDPDFDTPLADALFDEVYDGLVSLPPEPHRSVKLVQLLAHVGRALVLATPEAIAAVKPYILERVPFYYRDLDGAIDEHKLREAPGQSITWFVTRDRETKRHRYFTARVHRTGRPDADFHLCFHRKGRPGTPGRWHVTVLQAISSHPFKPDSS